MGVPSSGWFIRENPISSGWFGGIHLFQETTIYEIEIGRDAMVPTSSLKYPPYTKNLWFYIQKNLGLTHKRAQPNPAPRISGGSQDSAAESFHSNGQLNNERKSNILKGARERHREPWYLDECDLFVKSILSHSVHISLVWGRAAIGR